MPQQRQQHKKNVVDSLPCLRLNANLRSSIETVTKMSLPTVVTCSVCFDEGVVKRGGMVECPLCHQYCCTACCKRWLLTTEIPRCFGGVLPDNSKCDQEWSFEFLKTNFTASFLDKEFKLRQKQICTQRELARLPETSGTFNFAQAFFQYEKDTVFNLNFEITEPIPIEEKKAMLKELDSRHPEWRENSPSNTKKRIYTFLEVDRLEFIPQPPRKRAPWGKSG